MRGLSRLRCTTLWWTMLRLRGPNLSLVHVGRLRGTTLRSMLAGLSVVCLGLLRLLLRLCLLESEHLLLLEVLRLAVGYLTLKVHQVDRSHSGVGLHLSQLGSIQTLGSIW